jgi:putative endonuclease
MYYLYILKSDVTGVYYVGQTNNLERRMIEHNSSKGTKFTNRHFPWRLITAFEIGEERSLALKVEHHIKKQKSKKYINELIARGTIEMIIERYK